MKAVGTQESGYLAKQLLAAMQTERLDEPGTDCHTTRTIDLKLTAIVILTLWIEDNEYIIIPRLCTLKYKVISLL